MRASARARACARECTFAPLSLSLLFFLHMRARAQLHSYFFASFSQLSWELMEERSREAAIHKTCPIAPAKPLLPEPWFVVTATCRKLPPRLLASGRSSPRLCHRNRTVVGSQDICTALHLSRGVSPLLRIRTCELFSLLQHGLGQNVVFDDLLIARIFLFFYSN